MSMGLMTSNVDAGMSSKECSVSVYKTKEMESLIVIIQ